MTPFRSGLEIVLWEPEIPPNTGNIARSCAATGTPLHLVGKLGFQMDEKSLKRAGIDYWHLVDLHLHESMEAFESNYREQGRDLGRILCFSAHATLPYTQAKFQLGDTLLFGPESRGLSEEILARFPERNFVIPMPGGKVRSLNLSTSVGIVLYEAMRQLHKW